jgi:small subunit ribosomal protein S11
MGKRKSVQKGEAGAVVAEKAPVKSVSRQRIEGGRIYIQASFNNTIVTITDQKGGTLAWMSAGSVGFAGPKKATPFAASKVIEAIAEKVKRSGPTNVEVFVTGIGKGRDSAIRTIATAGFNILSIKDMTPVAHNGPRPRKVRRV